MLKNTRLGSFVKSMATASVLDVEVAAYNDSVLIQMDDLNTDGQLDKGVFADGSPTDEYAPSTIKRKRSEGKRYDHMTFNDTGDTYKSIKYKFNGELIAEWDDEHDLERNYGQIVGLTKESMEEIIPEISENIIDFIKSKL